MDLKIKEAREAAGLSQKELAEMVGVAPNTFHGYESGKHDPKSYMLKKIASACGTSIDFILGHNEKAPSYMTELSADALFIARCFERADDSDKKLLMSVAENINARTSEHQPDEGNIELGRAVLARMREELKNLQSDIGEVEQG